MKKTVHIVLRLLRLKQLNVAIAVLIYPKYKLQK